ncbi:MAG: HD domain-containing protein [Acidobacteria bacterium]|nr:HD domain-containing protein [Acidobacteriota bacterium]
MNNNQDKKGIIEILKINEKISHIKDIDSLLDRVLLEARTITNADAGSIYLLNGNKLTFEYVQNDTLMKKSTSNKKYLYAKHELEINNTSISGYVALNRGPLVIENVYHLPVGVPYTFNRSFDESSSYHTQSMLTVPLITIEDKVTGVLQIINARDKEGIVIPFSKEDEILVSLFANQAATAIERARMTREIILRMIKMAELRDPLETALHVTRVGTYAIELYQRWAFKRDIPEKEIKRVKDILKIAAMLHDVGKVAITDAILKKNSRLDDREFDFIKLHTIYGARLFTNSTSDWDDMAAEIALNHHEKWDGTGYPGHIPGIFNDHIDMGAIRFGPGKRADEIPLTARIVALADVYDALMSNRTYKTGWDEDKTLSYIESEKGKQFDPEIVTSFMDIYDVIQAIREKYSAE